MKVESSASHVMEKGNSNSSTSQSTSRDHGRGFFQGRERGGWSRCQSGNFKANVQRFPGKKYGYMKTECQERDKPVEKGALLVAEERDISNVFMGSTDAVKALNSFYWWTVAAQTI